MTCVLSRPATKPIWHSVLHPSLALMLLTCLLTASSEIFDFFDTSEHEAPVTRESLNKSSLGVPIGKMHGNANGSSTEAR
jgi:hypothetical protein